MLPVGPWAEVSKEQDLRHDGGFSYSAERALGPDPDSRTVPQDAEEKALFCFCPDGNT